MKSKNKLRKKVVRTFKLLKAKKVVRTFGRHERKIKIFIHFKLKLARQFMSDTF